MAKLGLNPPAKHKSYIKGRKKFPLTTTRETPAQADLFYQIIKEVIPSEPPANRRTPPDWITGASEESPTPQQDCNTTSG